MRVLITNLWLHDYAGTEVYTKDLAIALNNAGYQVDVYTPYIGFIGRDMRKLGINVVDSLSELNSIPDIIHGHHSSALDAINKFPEVPAIWFCHSGSLSQEKPIIHPSIKQYVAVDEFCMERLIENKITNGKIIYNWVDINRFKQKKIINDIPLKALVFSNVFSKPKIAYLQKACDMLKIELDVTGREFGNSIINPESILGNYDIVFAKAKCAIEAMACGCAVILHDYAGLGQMIMSDNFDNARRYNFGFKLLHPVVPKNKATRMMEEIKKYNPVNIKMVSDKIRQEANFDKIFREILTSYNQILNA